MHDKGHVHILSSCTTYCQYLKYKCSIVILRNVIQIHVQSIDIVFDKLFISCVLEDLSGLHMRDDTFTVHKRY